MKAKLLSAVVVGALSLTAASVAYAGDVCTLQGTAVAPAQILKSVQDQGYTIKDKIFQKAIKLNDECTYRVKVKDKTGQEMKLFFDPLSGNLIGTTRG
jgi:hypothetical protein